MVKSKYNYDINIVAFLKYNLSKLYIRNFLYEPGCPFSKFERYNINLKMNNYLEVNFIFYIKIN